MKKMIKVGLDIGNSAVKGDILSAQNGLLKDVLIPSAINYIYDEKYLTYPENDTKYVEILESPLEHPNCIIAIGNRAMDIPNYQQFDVETTSYKTNHEITTSLLFGVIADMVNGEQELDVILSVSIPIVESKTHRLIMSYQNLLQGTHKIRIHTKDNICDVNVNIRIATVYNEGQAGFLGLLDTVDTKFRQTMSALYAELGETSNVISTLEDFVVVDSGDGTTDVAVFRNKKFNADYSDSITKGYGTLLEHAMSNAQREGLTIESRKQLQDLLSSTNERRRAQKEIWSKHVNVERREYADQIVSTIMKAYGRQSYFDAIIFLGGGFSALTGYRLTSENKIHIDDDYLFTQLEAALKKNNKAADVIFGVPAPYSQTINTRGLMQILTSQTIK